MALTGRFTADFPWSCAQLFALADDIERYPEFISWCKSARVLSEDGSGRVVDNHFGAGPVDLHFASRAVADPPHRLDITAADGPFRRFRLTWTFTREGAGCRVAAEYEVAFRSPMTQALAHFAIAEVERRVMRKFAERAEAVYGLALDDNPGGLG